MRVLILLACVALAAAARPSIESLRSAPLPVLWQHLQEELADAVSVPAQCQSLVPDSGSLSGCQQQLPSISTDPTANNAALTKAQLDSLCSNDCIRNQLPKLRSFINCIADAGDPTSAAQMKALFGLVFSALDFVCTRDDSGQYCSIVIQQAGFRNAGPNTQSCAFFASTGCCGRTYINFVLSASGLFGGGQLSGASQALNNSIAFCGMQQGPSCPRPGDLRKSVVVHWVINNFNCTWLSLAPPATARLLFFYLAKDIATALNVPLGNVAIAALKGCSTVVTPAVTQSVGSSFPHIMLQHTDIALDAAGAVSVDYNVRGNNDAATAALQTTITTISQDSGITFPSTSAAFPSAASGPLTNNPSAATVTTTTVGTNVSAGFVAKAGWLVALVALLAAMLVSRV